MPEDARGIGPLAPEFRGISPAPRFTNLSLPPISALDYPDVHENPHAVGPQSPPPALFVEAPKQAVQAAPSDYERVLERIEAELKPQKKG